MDHPEETPLTQQELLEKLERKESLEGVQIGDIDFTDHTFEDLVDFSGAVFSGKTVFNGTQFSSGAKFTRATFSGESGANFSLAKFEGKSGADFSSSKFEGKGEALFMSADFSGEGGANFNGATFSGKGGVNFMSASFSGEGGANFWRTTFSGEGGAKFMVANFSGEGGANFLRAHFSGEGGANFNRATFEGKSTTNFAGANFSGNGGANFIGATFSGKGGVNFNLAKFEGEGETNFTETDFRGDGLILFSRVKFNSPQKVRFESVDLRNVSFYMTDIEEFTFRNITWEKPKEGYMTRKVLRDESLFDTYHPRKFKNDEERKEAEKNYFRQVEVLYRQLKRNYEEMRAYPAAGDFHFGELEMRRKQVPLWRQLTSLILPYKWLSGYGEKWGRALASFGIAVLLFSFCNLSWIQPKPLPNPVANRVQQTQWANQNYGVRYLDSALFTFKVMTLQRNLDFVVTQDPIWGRVGKLFLILEFLIGPTLIALMLLAIRRQFRR